MAATAAVRSTQAQAVDAVETWTKITQDAFGKIGDAPKSKSGPFDTAQFVLSGRRQAAVYASADVIWRDQRMRPVSRSSATKASLNGDGGSL